MVYGVGVYERQTIVTNPTQTSQLSIPERFISGLNSSLCHRTKRKIGTMIFLGSCPVKDGVSSMDYL